MNVACSKGKMWRKALELLEEMKENGITPNGYTYSAAIAACGNGSQWEKALELLNQVSVEDSHVVHMESYILLYLFPCLREITNYIVSPDADERKRNENKPHHLQLRDNSACKGIS